MNENTFSKIEPMLDELTEAELIYLMEKISQRLKPAVSSSESNSNEYPDLGRIVDVGYGPCTLPAGEHPIRTGGDLLKYVAGLWADRDDIGDSVEYAAELRKKAWRRNT